MSTSNQKIYKFIFTAYVKTVSLALKFPCVVSIIWKRGEKAQQVKQRKPIEKGIINFNQQLQLQCNMTFDNDKKIFEEKKTKFTILIFSQKGNKQAGQVHLDVAELLNSKNKLLEIQKTLEKCPDKNAKLTLSLSGYMKEQITPDLVSKRSEKTFDIQANLNQTPLMQPDFKKKKNQALIIDGNKGHQKVQSSSTQNKQNKMTVTEKKINPSSSNSNNSLPVRGQKSAVVKLSKQNQSLSIVEQQNHQLKQQIRQLRELQLQNENLRRKYEQADKKAQSYYKKKFKQVKQQQTQLQQRSKQIKQLMRKREELESTYCQCKQNIGKIFNYVIMSGNDKLMDFLETQDL